MRKHWIVLWILSFFLLYGYVLLRASAHPETAHLPYYALSSMSRLVFTYLICLAFGLVVGIFAAMNEAAGDIIIPILDILQSIPILGFFPIAVLIIVPVFGFATASIVLLFTSMAWSIVFGVIAGVKSIPQHIQDMAAVFDLRGWTYLKNIVLPSIYPSVIAGSILAFGSGWYFLIASEFVTYGESTYMLPGLGSYLNKASFQYGDVWMSFAGLMTIGLIAFCTHRFVWLKLDKNTRDMKFLSLHFGYEKGLDVAGHQPGAAHAHKRIHFNRRHAHQWFFNIFKFSKRIYASALILAMTALFVYIAAAQRAVSLSLGSIAWFMFLSFMRIVIAYALGVCIAVSIGYLMIRKPSTRSTIMPVSEVLQSVPALAYFPIIYLLLASFLPAGITLEIASILLLMTGMLWYLLFNVIEAVQHIPEDLNAVSQLYGIKGNSYIKDILVPAMLPALVTGSILAFGGGWNAIMVAEYVNIGGIAHSIPGIGSAMNAVAAQGNTPTILLILFAMTLAVLFMNHFVWRKLLNHTSKYVIEEE